jgi:hypothetical protein
VSDFTADDLFEAIDRAVSGLLADAGVTEPPVDALELLRHHYRYTIDYDEPHDTPKQYGDKPRRKPRPGELILHPDASEESKQTIAARTIARKLLPAVLTRLGIAPGTEQKGAQNSLIGPVTSRLLLPTCWFAADARRAAFNLAELKERWPGTGWETLAWRLLDVDDEPAVIAVIDDGSVSARRSNRFPATRKLTAAEEKAVEIAQETDEPATVRLDEWTATAWPTPGIPFRRIFVRAVPDGV